MITDHGQDDPIPFVLGEVDQAIARASRAAIEAHRQHLNARDRLQRSRRAESHEEVLISGQGPRI